MQFDQFGRRGFITLLGGTAANALSLGIWSLPLHAQSRIHRVGILFLAGEAPGFRKLADALRQLGYVEDRNITYVIRSAGTHVERLPELAREVVAGKPEVIVSAAAIAARALTDATQDIPIVLALVGDPVGLGFTSSMARPTANVTGFTTGHDTLAAKRLELLLELVPTARNVAFLWVPTNVQSQLVEERTREAAAALKVDLMSLTVTTPEEISLAIERAENGHAAALLIAPDPLIIRNRRTIIDECLLRNLPAMHSYSFEVRDGALISYGSDVGEDYERAAVYVDRILKGAKVSDLPFQEPTHIGLAINLRTARSIGLPVPASLMVRADEVIE
jgi:putative tryptophan/tyrosine transport system substrate-binding protein